MASTPSRTKTVVGVFDDYADAERVSRDLQETGIPRESIEVQSNFRTGAAGRGGEGIVECGIAPDEHRRPGFFRRIFGGAGGYEDEASHYSEALRRGSAIVTVTTDADLIDTVVNTMNHGGATDIDQRVEAYRKTGYERYDPTAPDYTHDEATREREQFRAASGSTTAEGRTTIPVIEEEVRVGKRVVRRGGVRIFRHVVETPVDEDVQLQEEHVRVERRIVDRPLEPGEAEALGGRRGDRTIELTETAEEPVVEKRQRVKEEIVVDKESRQRTEHVHDTVRSTEVEVERLNENAVDRD